MFHNKENFSENNVFIDRENFIKNRTNGGDSEKNDRHESSIDFT